MNDNWQRERNDSHARNVFMDVGASPDDPADDFLHQVFKWHAANLTFSGERDQTLHRLKKPLKQARPVSLNDCASTTLQAPLPGRGDSPGLKRQEHRRGASPRTSKRTRAEFLVAKQNISPGEFDDAGIEILLPRSAIARPRARLNPSNPSRTSLFRAPERTSTVGKAKPDRPSHPDLARGIYFP